ncbi:MAG: tetratricopeptide repeat protein [Candidatus Erginobacter occultus]|nr:tetratricopeptide repeat protein [Candidatus Erginobacter occultus]
MNETGNLNFDAGAEDPIGEANRHLDAGRWQEAERIYGTVREGEPSYPAAALGLGVIAYHQGRFEEADRLLAEVTREIPGYDRVPALRGRIYFQKDPPPDLAAITAALQENPADPQALFALALAYGRGGEYLRALDTLLEVLKVRKDYGEGKAREAYLKILEIINRKSPDGKKYERELSMILFS